MILGEMYIGQSNPQDCWCHAHERQCKLPAPGAPRERIGVPSVPAFGSQPSGRHRASISEWPQIILVSPRRIFNKVEGSILNTSFADRRAVSSRAYAKRGWSTDRRVVACTQSRLTKLCLGRTGSPVQVGTVGLRLSLRVMRNGWIHRVTSSASDTPSSSSCVTCFVACSVLPSRHQFTRANEAMCAMEPQET